MTLQDETPRELSEETPDHEPVTRNILHKLDCVAGFLSGFVVFIGIAWFVL